MPSSPSGNGSELVFVVDVSSFTENGFVGSTTYEGGQVNLEFDDLGKGVFISSEMASRLHVRKGSAVTVIIEDDKSDVSKTTIAGVGKSLRISDPRVYYAVGKEGGAVLRLRKT